MIILQQLRLCLSVWGMSVIRGFGLYLCNRDGSNSTLSPVVQGDIALRVNIQYSIVYAKVMLNMAPGSVPYDFLKYIVFNK